MTLVLNYQQLVQETKPLLQWQLAENSQRLARKYQVPYYLPVSSSEPTKENQICFPIQPQKVLTLQPSHD